MVSWQGGAGPWRLIRVSLLPGCLLVSLVCLGGCGDRDKNELMGYPSEPTWGLCPCCRCTCPGFPVENCSEEAKSKTCSDECCALMPNETGACDAELAIGRPYVLEAQRWLLAVAQPPDPDAPQGRDAWGFLHSDLGVGSSEASPDALEAQLLRAAMEEAGLASGALLPEGRGTLALEGRLPKMLASARAELEGRGPKEMASWHSAGLAEHASVGTFAKLCVELMVAGAPPRLLRRAIRAQEEELLHAHISLALAGADVAEERGGFHLQFPEHSLEFRSDLAALRAAAVSEGLVGEGRSALKLMSQGLRARQARAEASPLGELLWAMGCDEARHAQLASEVVEWLSRPLAKAHPRVNVKGSDVQVVEL